VRPSAIAAEAAAHIPKTAYSASVWRGEELASVGGRLTHLRICRLGFESDQGRFSLVEVERRTESTAS